MELFKAHRQWMQRPDDERFSSPEALYTATKAYAESARERENVPLSTLHVEDIDGDVQLVGKGGVPAKLTHWAFGQLATWAAAPLASRGRWRRTRATAVNYLRTLPAALASTNLNHGLATRATAMVNLLFHLNGGFLLRALTSDRYERIWNWEVAERLVDMQAKGWETARPDIRIRDEQLPLYASDHDMFAFMRSANRIVEPGNPQGLQRGLIVENSEVGSACLKMTRFLYREMCGNHIIYGAKDVTELSLRHIGRIRDRMRVWDAEIRKYLDSSASADEAKIVAAQQKRIAATKDEVLDALFGRKLGLSRKTLEASYLMVKAEEDGDPRTVWGIVQGITRYSQTVPYGDERTAIDRQAGKLLEAF